MKYLLMALMLVSSLSRADSVFLGGWSYHLSQSEVVVNSNHQMLVYERGGWFVGTFKNSFNHRTNVIGREFSIPVTQNYADVGLLVGYSHGYRECYGPGGDGDKAGGCPLIAPVIRFKTQGMIKPSVIFFGSAVILAARVDW